MSATMYQTSRGQAQADRKRKQYYAFRIRAKKAAGKKEPSDSNKMPLEFYHPGILPTLLEHFNPEQYDEVSFLEVAKRIPGNFQQVLASNGKARYN